MHVFKPFKLVQATWESEERVKSHYAEELKFFKNRKRAGNDPADYKQVLRPLYLNSSL